ncbi:MAG: ABC transporter permease [Desulfobacterales bacterium]|nr:MAG: ABC transporter permease [Desulfobacterales bacterium]
MLRKRSLEFFLNQRLEVVAAEKPETVTLGGRVGAQGGVRMLLRKVTGIFSNQLSGVAAALVIIFIISCFLSPYFFSSYNMLIVARALAFIGLITIGQSLLMMLGELDISLGAIGGLCGVIGGKLMVEMQIDPFVSFFVCIFFGMFCGLINGLLVTLLNLHSLVLTIGMAGVYSGTNLVLTKGLAITGIPDSIAFLGRGVYLGVPTPFIIMLFVLIITAFITMRTPFGRYIYAIGNNTPAAKMLGIKVNHVRVICFVIAGMLASIAGMLMVARLGTSQPSIGETWILPPIAAAVIGGVATTGGVGNPVGAILGAAIIGVIENIIVIFGVSPYWQSVVSGAIVVFAISFDSISRRYLRKED